MSSRNALIFVYGEPGPDVTDDAYNDWYDNEHAPARAALPEFLSTVRYKATDNERPKYLALYEINSPSVLDGDAYKSLLANASDNEKSIMARSAMLQRRIYNHVSTLGNPPKDGAAPFMLVVEAAIKDTPKSHAETHRWYEEEHIPMHSKIPGFIRARRFKLASWGEIARGDKETKPAEYLTIYEIESPRYLKEEKFKETVSTKWMKEITEKYVVEKRARVQELLKKF